MLVKTMLDFARRRSLLLLPILVIPVVGCPPANLFHGRLILINSTRGDIGSPALTMSQGGLEQRIEFPDMADGQAWVRDYTGDAGIVVLGDFKLSYVDKSGTPRTRTVPFMGEIPDYCHDDFFIEIDHGDQLHWGLLIYRNYRLHYNASITTHALAGFSGLLLGWMLWRWGQVRSIRVKQPKKTVTPEL